MICMAMTQAPSRPTDEALADAAKVGDRAAYATLIERYWDVTFAYAYAKLRSREDAEDVAQEAFVRAFEALSRFDPTASWGAYLMRILRNLCHDALRRRLVRRRPLSEPDTPPSPETLLVESERREEVVAAVADLPDKFRVPLMMHYASGSTYREIALALGLRESTVVGRLAGALRVLRRRLRSEVER
jgi:RNA polymerase sigma factor (sigma-70 family)